VSRSIAMSFFACALSACGPLPEYTSAVPAPQGPAELDAPRGEVTVVRIPGQEGARYPIRLSWPAVAGQRGQIDAVSADEKSMRVVRADGSNGVESKHARVAVRGAYEVISVGADGRASKSVLSHALVAADAGEGPLPDDPPQELASDARIEIIRGDADAIVTVDGHAASAELRAAIDEVIPLARTDAPPDDEVMGTDDPQPIGGSWPIESGLARESLTGEVLRVQKGAITGQMTLDSVGAQGGVDCIEVVGSMDIEPFDLAQLPAGAHIEKGRVHVVTRIVVPTSPMPRLADEMTMTTDVAMTLPGRGLVQLVAKKDTRFHFVPAANLAEDAPRSE
jgi:hypothetical protein